MDKLLPSEAMEGPLGLAEGEHEDKQCLCLHLAAARLVAGAKRPLPPVEAVREGARELRTALWHGAVDALAALGDAPPWVTQAEADVRAHCHDVVNAHHDKDYR
eukprot:13389702-Heterocapsa_arctica.AAC.1